MNKWEYQKHANILAFLTASEYQERKTTLQAISSAFETERVSWNLSCSASLFFRGIVDDFNDYDILIDMNDVEKAKEVLKAIGVKLEEQTIQKGLFTSPYYQEGYKGNVHFDFIGNITINAFQSRYCYEIDTNETDYITIEGNITIPLCPMEANLILYGMMEGWQAKRRLKRERCLEFLQDNGIEHPSILKNSIEVQKLPNFLREVVVALL